MTQVQTMTNIQLNFSLYQLLPGNKVDHAEQIPNYCTDPAASLEVQTAALEVNPGLYLKALSAKVYKTTYAKVQEYDLINLLEVKRLLNASPRERAEAAYITLQGARDDNS